MRERAGLSQADLSRVVDMTASGISIVERGERIPRIENLEALAAGCGCSVRIVVEPLDGAPPIESWAPESRSAADIMEAATPEDRALFLAVLRRMTAGKP